MPGEVDQDLIGLRPRETADAALERAARLGAEHTSVRVERTRRSVVFLRDGAPSNSSDSTDTAVAVQVLRGGGTGFASRTAPVPRNAALCAERAVDLAKAAARVGGGGSDPVDEPVHRATWRASYEVNPFDVPSEERTALLADWSRRLLSSPPVSHVWAMLAITEENKFYTDSAGTETLQRRVRTHPMLVAVGTHPRTGRTASLRTLGGPSGQGWEYLSGTDWDWEAELSELPGHLDGKLRAPSVEPGRYDLVIDPSNLWLTLHESVGHATELDRILGHEAGYAGTSFVSASDLGTLCYGSDLMNVRADRTAPGGLATVGFDDEGVKAQEWSLVEEGLLVGLQLDRRGARTIGSPRSNGCSYAESAAHAPLQRMPNVSLRPSPGGPSTPDLLGGVDDGIYVVGAAGWSIDMQRRDFQFTAQRCYRVRGGQVAEPVGDVAYRGNTQDFWAALSAVGGPQTYRLFGADLCAKGQPTQSAPVSHGCPTALFEGVSVRRSV
ncbi:MULTISPECIES: TldD/PmbA family protein [Nocardiopsis]|uniref:Peptidase C69 n=1 Tax=Nocardiopsis sinuspersici TaxID=501010 RepID=A0A1V3BXR2_9ACTN|nr:MULTISPECIES: TldD/PmbA family protein [Nocardiopsis]OOC53354.1 peptidase C69 [Nocardiopsis sinuspersici]